MSLLDVALDCVRRGWHVFPCVPRDKRPLAGLALRGFLDATNDEATVKKWWAAKPDANVGIATGASGLLVVDVDHGLREGADAILWLAQVRSPRTYMVQTGRRPEFGLQIYFQADGSRSCAGWSMQGCTGDIRADGGYVLAAGSIHPSGQAYSVWMDSPLAPAPAYIKQLAPIKQQFDPSDAVDDATADEWKTWLYEYADFYGIELRGYEKRAPNGWWLGVVCPWGGEHSSGDGAESSTVLGILDGRLAFECSHGTCKAAKRGTSAFKAEMVGLHGPFQREPADGPSVVLGSGTGLPLPPNSEPVDWRTLFHTADEVQNCPAPTFLIDQFLAKASICGIAAPVAQRKSLIALNVARSLCTGEPLFGVLKVHNRPKRVLYLCPEMGLVSLSARVRAVGMAASVGDTFFLRSMNLKDLPLDEIPDEALDGSVLIIDTAIRFLKGDEQKSQDTKNFSDTLFALQRKQGPDGAVVCLYHSPKATKGATELTLENCLRGSGELGASLTDAHGTRLQTPDDVYKSLSYIQHIKARDYKGLDGFEVQCNPDGLMTAVGNPFAERAVLITKNGGYKADKDGKDVAAEQVISQNPDLSIRDLVEKLDELGITRKKTWVSEARLRLRGGGSSHRE